MKTIRGHLTLWLLAGILTLVTAGGVLCYWYVESRFRIRFDEALVEKASGLASLFEGEIFGVEFELPAGTMPEFSGGDAPEYYQAWVNQRQYRSPTLGKSAELPRRDGTRTTPTLFDCTLPDGRAGRAVAFTFTVEPDEGEDENSLKLSPEALAAVKAQLGNLNRDVTLVCAKDTAEITEALVPLMWGLILAGGVLAVAVFGLVRWVVASGTRPLSVLADRIEKMEAETLSEARLAEDVPAELVPFQDGFRRFTRRIIDSMAREKRLTSNIAHELRTPVAELRTVTELARKWRDDLELRDRSLEDAYDIAVQMDRLLRTCLRMARLESGQDSVHASLVDVSSLVLDLCRQTYGYANARDLQLERDVDLGCAVRSDAELLELILGNLLDNAFHHAPEGTWVRVGVVTNEDRSVEIIVENPANDISDEDLERMNEPFWRKEESRSDWRHLGLGLAMVTSAAGAIHADLDFGVEDQRFVVRLRLPEDALRLSAVAPPPSFPAPSSPVRTRR